jgi:hypothetical protein
MAAASGGRCVVHYDDRGKPGLYVRIYKFNIEDIWPDNSMGTGVFPAFLKGGVEVPYFDIGCFQGYIEGSRAYSWPGMPPTVNINFDNAKAACVNKGAGHCLTSNWMWAAVTLLVLKSLTVGGQQPRGNTNYLKAHDAAWEHGAPAPDNPTAKTLTGSGPAVWRVLEYIADMVGNVWEWTDGLKLNAGLVFMPNDNNITLAEANWPQQTQTDILGAGVASESGWRGMTTNFGDLLDATRKRLAMAMVVPNIVSGNTPLALYSTVHGGWWVDKTSERLPFRGGSWHNGAYAGLAYLNLSNARSYVLTSIGLRPAHFPL